MAEDVVKRLKVTFKDGLPQGTRAHFEYEGQPWIAYPQEKNRRILAIIDRLVGIYSAITEDMVGMINDHPEDAKRVVGILNRVDKARKAFAELAEEKTKAATS